MSESGFTCGRCGEPLVTGEAPGHLSRLVAVTMPTGTFIVGKPPSERAIHRCFHMTREDQLEAMKFVASHR